MNKMMLGIVLLMLVILSSCTVNDEHIVLSSLNENSSFEYQLGTVITNDIRSEFIIIDGFGMYDMIPNELDVNEEDYHEYIGNNEVTVYEGSGYPDCLDDFVISWIETTDPDMNVYGLSVGQSWEKEDVAEFLSKKGYAKSETLHNTYENDDVFIRVYLEDGKITRLIVQLESTCSVIF